MVSRNAVSALPDVFLCKKNPFIDCFKKIYYLFYQNNSCNSEISLKITCLCRTLQVRSRSFRLSNQIKNWFLKTISSCNWRIFYSTAHTVEKCFILILRSLLSWVSYSVFRMDNMKLLYHFESWNVNVHVSNFDTAIFQNYVQCCSK